MICEFINVQSKPKEVQVKYQDIIKAIYIYHFTQSTAAAKLGVTEAKLKEFFYYYKHCKVQGLKELTQWPVFRGTRHYTDEAKFFKYYGISEDLLASIKKRYSEQATTYVTSNVSNELPDSKLNWSTQPHFFHQQEKMKVKFILNQVNYSEKETDSETDAVLSEAFKAKIQ